MTDDMKNFILDGPIVYIDTETTNHNGAGELDPWSTGDIAIVQTNIEDNIKISRWGTDVADWLKDLNSQGYTFVFHNAEFDLRWLRKYGVYIDKVFDTMIASQIINCGKSAVDKATVVGSKSEAYSLDNIGFYDNLMEEDAEFMNFKVKKASRFSHGLGATTYRYARVTIEKDLANSDWERDPLTPEQVRYAENDVKHLPTIVQNQIHFINELGLANIARLEMRVLPASVDIMTNGLLLDVVNWRKDMVIYGEKARELEASLNYQLGNELAQQQEEEEESLFGAVTMKISVKSPAQLKAFFSDHLIDGKPIEQANEATLKLINHPLIPDILKFKEYDKLSTTYGEGVLKFIKSDGRVHGNISQTQTDTGRFAISRPSLQNFPAEMLKGNLRTQEGYTLVLVDYKAVEARILAYAANDKNYIQSVNEADVHTANAIKIFKLSIDEVTSEMRTKAKILTFSIPYGSSAMGMFAKGLGDTLEETEEMIESFFKSFPDVKKFLQNSVFSAMARNRTQDYYGRIRWYELPDKEKTSEEDYRRIKKSITRQAQNHPIQSLSASVTKMALADIYETWKHTGLVNMILTVHDSVFFEVKDDYLTTALPKIKFLMENAARKVMPTLIAPVDFDLGAKKKVYDKLTGEVFKIFSLTWDEDTNIVSDATELYSEKTRSILKELKVKASEDSMSVLANVLAKIPLQTPEWQIKNTGFITTVSKTP